MTTSFMGRSIGIFILAALSAVAASANTNISACATISTAGNYDLTTSLTVSNSSNCFVVSGVHSGAVNFYCHDFTLTNSTSGTPGSFFILASDNAGATILFDHCHLTLPSQTTAFNGVQSTQGAFTFSSGVLTNTGLVAFACGAGIPAVITGSTFTNGSVQIDSCDASSVTNNVLNGYPSSGSTPAYAISVFNSISPTISGNVITGRSTTDGLDDGIVLLGGNNDKTTDSTVPPDTTTRTGAVITNNTISQVYDACIEFTGRWAYSTVADNDCQHAGVTGVGAYWNTSFDHMTFSGNSMSNSGSSGPFNFRLDNPNPPAGSFFTNNVITGNTYIGSFGASTFGSSFAAHPFATYSGNRFASNNFGYSVGFQSSGGVIDGGLNACLPGDAMPTGAVQCYPFPFNIPGGFLP